MVMIRQLNKVITRCILKANLILEDCKGELDEKAILIAFFVIVVAAAVVLLGSTRQQYVSPARQYGLARGFHA